MARVGVKGRAVAPSVLEVPVPDQRPSPGVPPPGPTFRAVLEDRLGAAGLDAFGRRLEVPEGTIDDGDPIF